MSKMSRTAILCCLICCTVSVAFPGWGAGARERSRSVLEGVAGLEKPITYCETKIPLGELVQRVAEETGVRLTAAPEVADEPVAVIVNALPARELLAQLARLLDYQWSRRSGVQETNNERLTTTADR